MFIKNRSVFSGFKKIAAAFVLASFVMLVATSFDADAATPKKHKIAHAAVKKPVRHKTTRKIVKSSYNPRHGSIVIDADTGTVISQNGADTQVYPASLTKLMTLLLTFEGLENGNVSLNQRVQISSNAAAQVPSKLDIPAGSSIEMKNAIYAVVTKSANDIAVAIAEDVGGTEGRFVYLMNQKAKQLGMNRTHFVNPSGLHNPQQVTTARDFARLSRYIIKNYPREYKYFSTRSFTYNGVINRNHNRLMETYAGMDGLKTGYVLPSGFNLAASAVRNKHRLIAVVFGGKTAQQRNNEVAGLLDDGFAKLANQQDQTLVSQNTLALPDPRLVTTGGIVDTRTAQTPARMQVLTGPAPSATTSVPVATPALTIATAEATPMPPTGAMGEMAGQGDIDPAVTRRFETGMMAINAIKTLKPGQISAAPGNMGSQQAAYAPAVNPSGAPTPQLSADTDDWAIQLGSYNSRVLGDQALTAAVARLPATMRSNARPIIAPLQAGDGWVYRARLQGFSREEASAACKYFTNCMAISPRAN